jgi:DNA end-binding protein Ku
MPRPLWKGALTFGLVTIPVELHTAVRDHRPKLRLLHAKDLSPVQYERVCVKEGEAVSWDSLVKGYEYQKGEFVVLTKDDFKAAAVEKSKAIQIMDFVDPAEVDDRYFETPYYLAPAAGGEHGYALLREAIRESGKIGIGKVILRDAQHVAAVEVIGDALVLSMLRFADELVDAGEFKFPAAANVRPKELQMAQALIGSFVDEWKPDKYSDEYRDNLMRIIQAKIKNRKPRLEDIEGLEPRQAEVIDLMERLQQSLAGARGRKGAAAPRVEAAERGRRSRPRKSPSARKRKGRSAA